MSDRREELKALAEELAERGDVQDAWLAKSFTDRLFIVEVPPEAELPAAVKSTLSDAGLRGADEVYDADGPDAGYAGHLEESHRYRYVDCETRGDLQSYVVD